MKYPGTFLKKFKLLFPNEEEILKLLQDGHKDADRRLRKLFGEKIQAGAPRVELGKICDLCLESLQLRVRAEINRIDGK